MGYSQMTSAELDIELRRRGCEVPKKPNELQKGEKEQWLVQLDRRRTFLDAGAVGSRGSHDGGDVVGGTGTADDSNGLEAGSGDRGGGGVDSDGAAGRDSFEDGWAGIEDDDDSGGVDNDGGGGGSVDGDVVVRADAQSFTGRKQRRSPTCPACGRPPHASSRRRVRLDSHTLEMWCDVTLAYYDTGRKMKDRDRALVLWTHAQEGVCLPPGMV